MNMLFESACKLFFITRFRMCMKFTFFDSADKYGFIAVGIVYMFNLSADSSLFKCDSWQDKHISSCKYDHNR